MRATRRSTRFLLAPALAGLLLLAACGAGDPEPAEPSEAPTEETTEPTEPTEPADDDAAAAPSEGAACLEGEWAADVDVVGQNAMTAPGLDAFGAEVVVSGSSTTTFDGSTMTSVYDDQQIEMTWSIEGQEFRVVTRYDGTLTGTYTATDTELTVSDVDASGLTLESTTFVNGELMELPGITDDAYDGFEMGGTSEYTCTSDELRLTPVAEGVDTSGFVSVLHRR